MLMFELFPKESAAWIAAFNFVFISILVLYGLSTLKHLFRYSLIAGGLFLVLCVSIISARIMEWDVSFLHQAGSAFYLVWLLVVIVESYLALKNKTRINDPGL